MLFFFALVSLQGEKLETFLTDDSSEAVCAERTVGEVLPLKASDDTTCLVGESESEEKNASWGEGLAHFPGGRVLSFEREVETGIPGGYELVFLGKLPRHHVVAVKRELGVGGLSKANHLLGDVESFYFEAVLLEEMDESPSGSATHIERQS